MTGFGASSLLMEFWHGPRLVRVSQLKHVTRSNRWVELEIHYDSIVHLRDMQGLGFYRGGEVTAKF
jgi:hypothetical protein